MRRRTISEGLEHMTEIPMDALLFEAHDLEHRFQRLRPMVADAPAADLKPVHRDIVLRGEDIPHILLREEVVHELRLRRGERIVREGPPACVGLLEEREIDHPAERKEVRIVLIGAKVGPIGTMRLHRLLVGKARERDLLDLLLRCDRLYERDEELLVQAQDVLLFHETHLHVELGEFRLTVAPRILIAETSRDLEIFLDTRHHKQLFVLLRRLRECVEIAPLDAGRNEIVTRTLRRAAGEVRRLHLVESPRVEEIADERDRRMAECEVLRKTLPPKIEIAVFEAPLLMDIVPIGIHRDRHLLRGIENLKAARKDLMMTRRDLVVHHILRTPVHRTRHLHDILKTEIRCPGYLGTEHHLHEAAPIAQIDENKLTVVPASMNPSEDGHILALLSDDIRNVRSRIHICYGNINTMLTFEQMLGRFLIALILGAILGLERELVGKEEAGIRTLSLVTSGAAIFAMIGLSLPYIVSAGTGNLADVIARNSGFLTVIANIVVGVGFLGAGIIMKMNDHPRGVTTAALIWSAAAIGTLVGIGLPWFAGTATVILAVILYFLRTVSIAERIERKKEEEARHASA